MSWLNQVRESERSTPRTTLGFYNVFVAIIFGGGATMVGALAVAGAPAWAVVSVAATCLLFVLAVLVTVIALNTRAPEKLQLGQVNARDYTQITHGKTELGDARTGLRAHEELDESAEDIVDAEVVKDEAEGPEA